MSALAWCVLAAAASAHAFDQTQLEKYDNKYKKYQVKVPGKEPITIIEAGAVPLSQWVDISLNVKDKDSAMKNIMTDIIHDVNGDRPRCYGPSCRDGFVEDGPQEDVEEFLAEYPDRSKDFGEYPKDRLQAISALAEKLKNDRLKSDRYYGQAPASLDQNDDDGRKVYTAWNKMKVKQHKHPYDDKDGWVSLEPVAWSTSKISKWKPNVKKHKPSQWNDDEEDRYSSSSDVNKYIYEGMGSTQNTPFKKPSNQRPAYINNQLHLSASSNWNSEVPRPSWNKPDDYYSYPSTWNPDEGRKPQKPNCDHEEEPNHDHDDTVFYGLSDSGIITDSRPSHTYEYEALKRPFKRPTQVVYAGSPELDGDRSSRPPYGDGHWVLLSTTKGYRNKKRQRSLSVDTSDPMTVTSHQAVALTVLPMKDAHANMTTSHGGLLEVERSFKTVEESKRDMDRRNEYRPDPDPYMSSSNLQPVVEPVVQKLVQKKYMTSAPDSAAVLAAVGAGMVPATMAMVVPMVLGRRKRDLSQEFSRDVLLKYE